METVSKPSRKTKNPTAAPREEFVTVLIRIEDIPQQRPSCARCGTNEAEWWHTRVRGEVLTFGVCGGCLATRHTAIEAYVRARMGWNQERARQGYAPLPIGDEDARMALGLGS